MRHRRDGGRNTPLIVAECVLALVAVVALVVALDRGAVVTPQSMAKEIDASAAGSSASSSASARDDEGTSAAAASAAPVAAQEVVERTGRIERAPQVAARPGTAGKGQAAAPLAEQAEAAAEAARTATPEPFSLRVATLNVLGSQHTAGKGGMGPGTDRAYREAALIRDRGIDLIGMQEVQRDQRSVFLNQLPGWTIWPQEALGRQGYRLQIAFRNDRFELLDGGSVTHTFDSQQVPIPYALLRDRTTGGQFYVINAHNSPRHMQSQRLASSAIEADLVNRLSASGHPVLMVGDMNEHVDFFCRIAARTGLVSANGGYYSGGCHAPARPHRIDWILGKGGVDFSGYVQDGATKAGGMSDHYLIYSDATITDGVAP